MRVARCGWIFFFPLFADINPMDLEPKVSSDEEAFFLRRISDFWQEGEYSIAKSQMQKFLSFFPQSAYADLIRISLGDLLLLEKNFSAALESYVALSSSEFRSKAFLNRMQCLYRLEWYSTLADECEEYLEKAEDSEFRLKATFYLAIALYHQCLNASKNPETLFKLAKRAEPHFESLIQGERSFEVTQAFAHLCWVLKEYPRAANLYLELAGRDPLFEEEMTFQAALVQAEYDKNLAMQSFEKIAKQGQKRAKEAAYHHFLLALETESLQAIVNNKESILSSIPEDRLEMAHLFLGRSLCDLKKWDEAIVELTAFLQQTSSASSEAVRSGILCLVEAAHYSSDVSALDLALAKLSDMNSSDEQIMKTRLLRAQLLKKVRKFDEAREELNGLLAFLSDFPDRAVVVFEYADLEYQAAASWEECRFRSLTFLEHFPTHELAPFAWRYVATASSHLAHENAERREQLVQDLKALLEHKNFFPLQEINDWEFYLAQAYFHLGWFEKAIESLTSLLAQDTLFPQRANAYLLFALCYKERYNDLASFCLYGETALSLKADLMELAVVHMSLFNAYLQRSKEMPEFLEKSAEHLFEGFLAHADISQDNLFWLGEWYLSKRDFVKASSVFSFLVENSFNETACYKLEQIYSWMGQSGERISQLEKYIAQYIAEPQRDWQWEREIKLLLAEAYEAKGLEEKALNLFNEITEGSPAAFSEAIAKAYLEKARLESMKCTSEDQERLTSIATQLKNLVLQRKLEYEPIHLEAALEYVELFARNSSNYVEKKLALLEKTKKDFESADDLLTKDYFRARLKYPDKNQVFESYMKYIDEEILVMKSELATEPTTQKELQAKAKDLLLQIKGECTHPSFVRRVASRLQDTDVSVVK